jgi:hypothetical protein
MSLHGGGAFADCALPAPMASDCIARTVPSATCHVSQAESGPTVMRAELLLLVPAWLEFGCEKAKTFLVQVLTADIVPLGSLCRTRWNPVSSASD